MESNSDDDLRLPAEEQVRDISKFARRSTQKALFPEYRSESSDRNIAPRSNCALSFSWEGNASAAAKDDVNKGKPAELAENDVVDIVGFTMHATFNGSRGTIVHKTDDSRYDVQLMGSMRGFTLKLGEVRESFKTHLITKA